MPTGWRCPRWRRWAAGRSCVVAQRPFGQRLPHRDPVVSGFHTCSGAPAALSLFCSLRLRPGLLGSLHTGAGAGGRPAPRLHE